MKIAIILNCPIEFKRIRNGERVIEDTCLAEIEIEAIDGEVKGKSPLQKLNEVLDEYQREIRSERRRSWKAKITQSRGLKPAGANK